MKNAASGRLLSRRRAAIEMAAWALGAVPMIRGAARAAIVPNVGMVEEDWRLIIATPDKGNHAPGVKMIMSTQGDLLGYSADYSINYHKEGEPAVFAAGGFGIEVCNPDQDTPTAETGPSEGLLDTPGENLTWTQRLKLDRGTLTFSLRNTQSTTWDSTSGEVLSVATGCPLDDLTGYDPAFSVAQSGPVWWPSRVTSLVLTAVRYYDPSGKLLLTDPVDRVAYP